MKFYLLPMMCLVSQCSSQIQFSYEVQDLAVEPGYRMAKLTWRYPRGTEPPGFLIDVCERTPWRSKDPCKPRLLSLDGSKQKTNIHDVLRRSGRFRYEANLYQLRMQTNYSFTVEPNIPYRTLTYGNRSPVRTKNRKNIEATTFGFDATTTNCLGNITEVKVQTGPFFTGRISVDNIQDDRCAVYGDPSSPNTTYTLIISHKLCGSVKFASKVETPVLVHENRELVTHNARRFLVVCNFAPDNITVKAAVAFPTTDSLKNKDVFEPIGHSVYEADPNEIFDVRRDKTKLNNFRDSRFVAEQATALEKKFPKTKRTANDTYQYIIVFMSMAFVFVSLVGTVLLVRAARAHMAHSRPQKTSTDQQVKKNVDPSIPSILKATDDTLNLVEHCSLQLDSVDNDYENLHAIVNTKENTTKHEEE